MTLELSQEALAWLFLWSLVMGFCAGAAYDLLKFRRRLVNFGKIPEIVIMSLEDIVFFTLWSAAFCILLYAVTFGVVRIEAIFSQLLGFCVYKKTLGVFVMKLLNKVAKALNRLFSKLISKLKIHIPKKHKRNKKQRKRKDHFKNERTR